MALKRRGCANVSNVSIVGLLREKYFFLRIGALQDAAIFVCTLSVKRGKSSSHGIVYTSADPSYIYNMTNIES